MSDVVLDASAVLAVLHGEPGANVVVPHLRTAVVGAVNLAEVVTKLVEKGATDMDARRAVDELPIDVEPFDAGLAFDTGFLRPATRRHGLSLGDRSCLALAARLALPVLTAERIWAKLDLPVTVEVIR